MRLLCSERRSCLSAAPVARRRSVGASSAPVSEPGRRLTRDAGRYHVAALELAVAYLVSGAFEPGDDPAAAGVDREPRIVGAVREQVAVRYTERESVGSPVGVASDRHARGIYRAAGEGVPQPSVHGYDVRTVLPSA